MKPWRTVGAFLLGLASCQLPQQESEIAPSIEYVKRPKVEIRLDKVLFNQGLLVSEIENYFLDLDSDSVLHQHDLVQNFYALQGYEPHWIDISDTLQHADFLSILRSSELHGLNENTYHFERLATNLENLSFFYFEAGSINYQLWAESEILFSDALILLAKHFKYGAFDPLNCENYHYFISSDHEILEPFQVFYEKDLSSFFENLLPSNVHYKSLQNEFAKRLETPENLRTSKDVDTLNVLRVNLERWRWNSLFADTGRVVYVNIPAFEMLVFEDQSLLLTSKVCVGTKRPRDYASQLEDYKKNPRLHKKPAHFETPIFRDDISYMVLNPLWNVPSSIAKKTILRNIQKDSNYLSKMGYLVYSGSEQIDPHSVDWESVTMDNFPYRFQQPAGDQNALGKMKFMFPNRFAVYLHDTPTKRDFSRQNRAVSHGCVRVENYMELALILLSDMPKYDLDHLRKAIGLDKKTDQEMKTINLPLKSTTPIIIDYKTAWLDIDGNLQIFSDVYERDRLVLDALGR
ncbi:MAG: L,D-transpeptidase family protein [Bacteroidales bacterium]|nr:L,D-transpeptidase family protein [Bacteroidales bacterium]